MTSPYLHKKPVVEMGVVNWAQFPWILQPNSESNYVPLNWVLILKWDDNLITDNVDYFTADYFRRSIHLPWD